MKTFERMRAAGRIGWIASALWSAPAAAPAAAPKIFIEDADPAAVRPASLDLVRAGLFRLEDGSLVLRLQTAERITAPQVRIMLDLDGAGSGLRGDGADWMIEGSALYRFSAAEGGWSWSEANSAVSVDESGFLTFLLPEVRSATQVRWRLETLSGEWSVADRLPANGYAETLLADVPSFPVEDRGIPTDLGELVVNQPVALSVEWKSLIERVPWEPVAADAAPAVALKALPGRDDWPVVLEIRDPATGRAEELKPLKAFRAGAGLRWEGRTEGGVDWCAIVETPTNGEIRLHGAVESTSEKALQVFAGLRYGDLSPGWFCGGPGMGRPLAGATGDLARTRYSAVGGRDGQSLFPLGVLSAGNGAVSAEADLREFRLFRIVARTASRAFGIETDLGLSPQTTKFPGRATFSVLFRALPSGGPGAFDAAVRDYMDRHPQAAGAVEAYDGIRAAFSKVLASAAAGRGRALIRGVRSSADATATATATEGPLPLIESDPWNVWLPQPSRFPLEEPEALRRLRFLAAAESQAPGEAAVAAQLGAVRRTDHSILFRGLPDRAAAGLSFLLNTDPELLVTKAAPFNRAMSEWRLLKDLLAGETASGVFLRGFDRLDASDSNRAALSAGDHGCSFDRRTGRPVLPAAWSACEFATALSGAMRKHGGRAIALESPGSASPLLAAVADIVVDTPDAPVSDWAALRVAAGCAKPAVARWPDGRPARSGAVRAFLERCILWGVWPDVADIPSDEAGALSPVYRTLLPLAVRTAASVWEPGSGVTVSEPDVLANVFRETPTVRHLVFYNPADRARKTTVAVPDAPGTLFAVEPLRGRAQCLRDGGAGEATFDLDLAPGETSIRTLCGPADIEREIEFLKGWTPQYGQADAAAVNLASSVVERETQVEVEGAGPASPVRGAAFGSGWTIRNAGDTPIVVSAVRLTTVEGQVWNILLEPRVVGPREALDLKGEVPAGQEPSWVEWQWTVQRGDREWKMARRALLDWVEPVEVSVPEAPVRSATGQAALAVRIANRSAVPQSVTLAWESDESVRRTVTVEARSSTEVSVPAAGKRGRSVRVRIQALLGDRTLLQKTCEVSFLDDGENRLRDSGLRIEWDGADVTGEAAALADGVREADHAASGVNAWLSAPRSGPASLRLELPAPAPARQAVVHWPVRSGTPRAAAAAVLRVEGADGQARETRMTAAGPAFAFDFEEMPVKAVEVRQEAGGGSAGEPDRIWVSEVELK